MELSPTSHTHTHRTLCVRDGLTTLWFNRRVCACRYKKLCVGILVGVHLRNSDWIFSFYRCYMHTHTFLKKKAVAHFNTRQ